MKVLIDRKQMNKILNVAKFIVSAIDIQQITNSILLRIKENTLKVTTFNNEIQFESEMPVETSSFSSEFSILLDAKIFINIFATNIDTEIISLEIDSSPEDLVEGNGFIKIIGDSNYSLPVRSTLSYPDLPNLSDVDFQKFDFTEFISILNQMSKFTDKSSYGYERGVCFTGKRVLATDHKRGLIIKKDLPISQITITPTVAKPLLEFSDICLGEIQSPRMLVFKGNLGNSISYLGVFPLSDVFPYEKIGLVIKEWLEGPTYKITIEKNLLSKSIHRFKGFILDAVGRIDASISKNKMQLFYKYNQYESKDIINCIYNDEEQVNVGFSMKSLEDLIELGENTFELNISKKAPVLFYVTNNVYYFCGLFEIE